MATARSRPCPTPSCPRVYRSRKALNKHRRDNHGAPLHVRPDRGACAFVAASLQLAGGLACPGCRQRFATRSSLRRHLSGRYRRPPSTSFPPLNRVQPPSGRPLRFRVHDAARPQRARTLHLALRQTAAGSAEVELSLPVRLVCLRTARNEAHCLVHKIDMKRDDRSLTVTADAPAVSLHDDVFTLSKSCRKGGKLQPTVFAVELAGGIDIASAWTEPENVLEAVPDVLESA